MVYPLNFYTTHCQFYIYDKDSIGDTASRNFWTDEAFNDRLAIEEGVLGVGTECYGPLKGNVVTLDASNDSFDIDKYDHIVEAGIQIKSGVIQVLDCPSWEIQLEIAVNPGLYKVRIYSINLSSVIDDEGDDFYRVEIWPDTNMARTVLKRFLR